MLISAAHIFFVSGFAALVYQVTWQRMLAIFSGADVYSATVVIGAFMAGLGCGALAGGFVADRVSPTRSLTLFIAAETGIALFGLFSAFILYEVLHEKLGHLAASPAAMAVLLFASLLWPTSLMGASLPLLARALVRRTDSAGRTIGWLYAANTFGAAIGALTATWVLLRHRGMDGTLPLAAYLNLVCAAAAIPLAIALRGQRRDAASPEEVPWAGRHIGPPAAPPADFALWEWACFYGLAGFIALSFEIVWFRMLGVMLKSTSVTFGTLLAHYLFWLGLGAAFGSIAAGRFRRPAVLFLLMQAAAAVYAALALAMFVWALPQGRTLTSVYEYFGSYDPIATDHTRRFLQLYVVLPAGVIGPATFLMGSSFPLLQRAVQTHLPHLGRRVAVLLVANIAGSTAGAVVTGWILLATLGTAGTLRALVVLAAVFAVGAVRARRVRAALAIPLYGSVAAGIAAVSVSLPDGPALWARLHGAAERSVVSAEDASGVAVLKGRSRDFSGGVVVFVNGLGQSWLPYGGIHTELGALPALIHPAPREAAVIGLGSGDTLFAMAGRRDLERITSIEIIGPQLDTLRQAAPLYPYPGLVAWLEDPRIVHVVDDGRAYLRDRRRQFDILEADALRPTSAYAGNLYSDAYFQLLRQRLRPQGFAVTWVPTDRVERTFLSVFPHAVRFGDVLIGSNDPIQIDHDAVRKRLVDPDVRDYYARAGIDIRELLERSLGNAVSYRLTAAERARISDINTDLFPRDEVAR